MNIAQTNDERRADRFVVRIASVAAICGLLFGFDTGVISGALLFLKTDFSLSPWWEGVVTSAVLAGACAGAGFSGRLTDRLGRRRMVIAVAILFFIASLVTALAPNLAVLIAGRVLVGLAIGVCSYAGPLISPKSRPRKIEARWCR